MRKVLGILVALGVSLVLFAKEAPANVMVWEKEGSKVELNGDIRFRYEQDSNQRDDKDDRDRDRARVRLRLGTSYFANENVEFSARLATNSGDPHSTHHDLALLSGGKDEYKWGLDQAYLKLKYEPGWIWLGKGENVVWDRVSLTWDADVNPEGVALGGKFGDDVKFWGGLGYYLINETGWDKKDDTMLAYQVGGEFGDSLKVKAAVGGYSLNAQDEDNEEGLSTPGGTSTYTHGMLELGAKEMAFSPILGLAYVTSNVDDKYIGSGAKSSDKNALAVYLLGKAGMFDLRLAYFDVGYAGATGLGSFSQDDYPHTNNYTGWDVSIGTKVFKKVDVSLKYYYQEVKNADIKPEAVSYADAQTGKGNKRNRIQINFETKF